jgi:hypothetical protein
MVVMVVIAPAFPLMVVLVVRPFRVVFSPHPASAAAPIPGDSHFQYSTPFRSDAEHLSGQMFLFSLCGHGVLSMHALLGITIERR